jgi:hypothetical protein
MRIILTASADTTIYQRYPLNNVGLDEIIEVGKVTKPEDLGIVYSASAARALLNFNITNSGSYPNNASYYLNLKIANASKLPYSQELIVNRISGSWVEGSGYFVQQNVNPRDGATWSGSNAAAAVSWSNYGGDYYTTPSQSITLNEYPLQDLRVDVSSILQPVVSQSLQWSGLLVRFPNASETDYVNEGNIKFFSKQTHTIYQPTLEVAWDDSTFVTGSLKRIPNTYDIQVVPKNPKETYLRGSKEKVRLVVRDKYPQKNFDATLRYKNVYYLPTSSYFGVTDVQANTPVVPMDQFAKLSCDATGSYFVLDTSTLYKNRYYTVTLEINNGDSDTNIIPELFTFLVK